MAENLAAILGIELLAAAQGCDFRAPLRPSPALAAVIARCCASRCRRSATTATWPTRSRKGDRAGRSRRACRPPRRRCSTTNPFPNLDRERSPVMNRRLDNDRIDPRAARARDQRQELADRSAAAHADEQSRSRGGREAGASSSSMAASAGPRATGSASTASSRRCASSRTTRRCWCSRASRSASSAPMPMRRAC